MSTVSNEHLLSRLNSVDRPTPVKAKVGISSPDTCKQIIQLALMRAGMQQKELGDDSGRIARQMDGTGKDRWGLYDALMNWPAELWAELVVLIALHKCKGRFHVERVTSLREVGG